MQAFPAPAFCSCLLLLPSAPAFCSCLLLLPFCSCPSAPAFRAFGAILPDPILPQRRRALCSFLLCQSTIELFRNEFLISFCCEQENAGSHKKHTIRLCIRTGMVFDLSLIKSIHLQGGLPCL